MSAHTPGPWTVRADAATRWPYAVEAIGTVAWVAWSEQPRMKELLQAAVRYADRTWDEGRDEHEPRCFDTMRAILRDVEGESHG